MPLSIKAQRGEALTSQGGGPGMESSTTERGARGQGPGPGPGAGRALWDYRAGEHPQSVARAGGPSEARGDVPGDQGQRLWAAISCTTGNVVTIRHGGKLRKTGAGPGGRGGDGPAQREAEPRGCSWSRGCPPRCPRRKSAGQHVRASSPLGRSAGVSLEAIRK